MASTHTYNTPKNRLLAADNPTFTYDNEGQLATGYGVSYAFDSEHRLTAIGATASFRYDGIGNRLEATRNGVATRYVYDLNGNLVAEADSSNTITRYYIHGIGLMALVTPAGQTYCYHFNQVGSTVALTDMNQAVVNQYAYTPFGEIANQGETISQPFTFVGQMGVMAEPNGFYYMRARYYDPEVRRFISEDPIGFNGGDLNLYAYVGNNPTMFVDPNGLDRISVALAIADHYAGLASLTGNPTAIGINIGTSTACVAYSAYQTFVTGENTPEDFKYDLGKAILGNIPYFGTALIAPVDVKDTVIDAIETFGGNNQKTADRVYLEITNPKIISNYYNSNFFGKLF